MQFAKSIKSFFKPKSRSAAPPIYLDPADIIEAVPLLSADPTTLDSSVIEFLDLLRTVLADDPTLLERIDSLELDCAIPVPAPISFSASPRAAYALALVAACIAGGVFGAAWRLLI